MEDINKGISIVRTMKQLMNIIRQNIEHHFHGSQITGPQGMLMGTLSHFGEMKISDLSDKLGLSNSTVSGIIDRLEKQGFVERIRSKEDRRVVFVNVTEEFRKSSMEHFQEVERKLGAMMSRATAEELDTVQRGLDTLKQILERQKRENN